MNWSLIQSIIIVIGAISVGAGYVYAQFRQGDSKSASELINILQAKDTEQKALLADYQRKFEQINKELGILEGKLHEKEQKIEEYMNIMQGKSPEQTQYMDYMTKFTKDVADYMHETTSVLTEIKTFMVNLNESNKNVSSTKTIVKTIKTAI